MVQLQPPHSLACANVNGASGADGAAIIQYTCVSGAADEQFMLRPVG
jgi:hypothetical protein